ncbi:MAG: OmpA family protein [Myxococcaceae bacterium]|nr:OmpA family protein [Myxococcaceae bacterium]
MRALVIVVLAVAAAACVHTPKVEPVTAAPPPKVEVVTPPTPAVVTQASCAADSECRNGFLCVRSLCVAITPELAECATVRVHFDFNEALVRPDDEVVLQRMARCLRADVKLRVTIEGHADERGTEEYNLVLGNQRAYGVERYLDTLGVSRSQLASVSYGYERPLCTEHDEACWSKNRRVALKPTRAP